MGYGYVEIAINCQCKTRTHRRKNCPLRGMVKCETCGIAYPDDGGFPHHCDACTQYHEERERYLGEYAIAHDTRNNRPYPRERQLTMLDGDAYDWTGVEHPRWPFLWSRPKPVAVNLHGPCTLCGEHEAPRSQMWESDTSAHTLPVCTPCIRLGNLNARFSEPPIESIAQLREVIEWRNWGGTDISDLREDWVPAPRNQPKLHPPANRTAA